MMTPSSFASEGGKRGSRRSSRSRRGSRMKPTFLSYHGSPLWLLLLLLLLLAWLTVTDGSEGSPPPPPPIEPFIIYLESPPPQPPGVEQFGVRHDNSASSSLSGRSPVMLEALHRLGVCPEHCLTLPRVRAQELTVHDQLPHHPLSYVYRRRGGGGHKGEDGGHDSIFLYDMVVSWGQLPGLGPWGEGQELPSAADVAALLSHAMAIKHADRYYKQQQEGGEGRRVVVVVVDGSEEASAALSWREDQWQVLLPATLQALVEQQEADQHHGWHVCQLWQSLQSMGRVAWRFDRYLRWGELVSPRDQCGRDRATRGTAAYAISSSGAAALAHYLRQHEHTLVGDGGGGAGALVLDLRGGEGGGLPWASAEMLLYQCPEATSVWVANYPMFRDMTQVYAGSDWRFWPLQHRIFTGLPFRYQDHHHPHHEGKGLGARRRVPPVGEQMVFRGTQDLPPPLYHHHHHRPPPSAANNGTAAAAGRSPAPPSWSLEHWSYWGNGHLYPFGSQTGSRGLLALGMRHSICSAAIMEEGMVEVCGRAVAARVQHFGRTCGVQMEAQAAAATTAARDALSYARRCSLLSMPLGPVGMGAFVWGGGCGAKEDAVEAEMDWEQDTLQLNQEQRAQLESLTQLMQQQQEGSTAQGKQQQAAHQRARLQQAMERAETATAAMTYDDDHDDHDDADKEEEVVGPLAANVGKRGDTYDTRGRRGRHASSSSSTRGPSGGGGRVVGFWHVGAVGPVWWDIAQEQRRAMMMQRVGGGLVLSATHTVYVSLVGHLPGGGGAWATTTAEPGQRHGRGDHAPPPLANTTTTSRRQRGDEPPPLLLDDAAAAALLLPGGGEGGDGGTTSIKKKFRVSHLSEDGSVAEFPTLARVSRHCAARPQDVVWYVHNKGAYRAMRTPSRLLASQAWRKYMEHFIFFFHNTNDTSKDHDHGNPHRGGGGCMHKLLRGEADVCGTELRQAHMATTTGSSSKWSSSFYYAGNFWWSTCRHINRLPGVEEWDLGDRGYAEAWLGMVPTGSHDDNNNNANRTSSPSVVGDAAGDDYDDGRRPSRWASCHSLGGSGLGLDLYEDIVDEHAYAHHHHNHSRHCCDTVVVATAPPWGGAAPGSEDGGSSSNASPSPLSTGGGSSCSAGYSPPTMMIMGQHGGQRAAVISDGPGMV